MNAVTTYSKPKPFTWSYSRLKNFETCPKRHWHIDLQKDFKEEESEHLTWGFTTHDGLAKRIGLNVPLPNTMKQFEPWAVRAITGEGKTLVEQRLAFREDFSPCGYFDKGVWFRGVADVIKINGLVALVMDWKTGKILEDSQQLALLAQCIFSHYPEVQHVRTMFVWLAEDAETTEDFGRRDMAGVWNNLLPRVQALRRAYDTTTYVPNPGRLCRKWCPVTVCPHHGGS